MAARIAAATAGPEEIVGGSPTPRSAVRRVRVGVLEHLDGIGGMSRMVGIR